MAKPLFTKLFLRAFNLGLSANAALAKLYGFESSEAMAECFTRDPMWVFADPSRPRELLREVQLHGSVTDLEMPIRRVDGRVIWVSKNAHTVRDEQGNLLYIEGTVKDITDRKEAEAHTSHLQVAQYDVR